MYDPVPKTQGNVDRSHADYDRAESVLQPAPYPDDFPTLKKLTVLEEQAKRLGLHDKFRRVNQTTRFIDGPNSSGVEMNASTLTGMDCTGVNDGSKSSTLMNYLSDAWNWGAEMYYDASLLGYEANTSFVGSANVKSVLSSRIQKGRGTLYILPGMVASAALSRRTSTAI